MKRMSFGLAVLIALSACTVEKPYKSGLEELSFTSGIEERVEDKASSPETKTYLDQVNGEYQIHWNQGDAITIFFDTFNGKYLFTGNDGSTAGGFNPASSESGSPFTTGIELERYYAIYPYAESTSISSGVISFEFPATQTYAENSFGQGAGVMSAVTAGPADTHLSFRNVTGYLKLFIYGGAKVQSIVLTGKNEEKLSGPAQITAVYGEAPVTVMTGATASVTLACGGVQTGATEDEATVFYIAIPPTNFTQGFTVEITDVDGKVMTMSTNSPTAVNRNRVKPMPAFKFEGVTPEPPTPPIPDLPEVSGTLPVLYVYTPNEAPVVDKVNWITDSHAYLKAGGEVTDLGVASIKGRGNTTWGMDKKPYALKLDKKASLLGMPKDKRWDLLANFIDRTRMRNDVALELGRRLGPDFEQNYLDWTPRGQYVELVLNGTHMGNYYLVEHIKVAEKRIPITEMKSTDTGEPAITGGYIFEFGTEMDEVNKFYTNSFPDNYPYKDGLHGGNGGTYKLPVMIKEPDEKVLTTEQFNWVKNYINGLQSNIVNNNGGWTGKVDMDSFICWMFIQEVVGNYEPFHPKSCYMHKDREGKLMMGPLWDFDYGTFKSDYAMCPVYHYALWYPFMLKNSTFKARVKELYPIVRPLLRDVANNYIDARAAEIKSSVERDWGMWPTTSNVNGDIGKSFDSAVASLKSNLNRRLDQMTNEVNNM